MDTKKQIKQFIDYICDWVEYKYKDKEDIYFIFNLTNDKISHIIADKGIEKRIEKQLNKKLNVDIKVRYTPPLTNIFLDGKLIIIIQKPIELIKYTFSESNKINTIQRTGLDYIDSSKIAIIKE